MARPGLPSVTPVRPNTKSGSGAPPAFKTGWGHVDYELTQWLCPADKYP